MAEDITLFQGPAVWGLPNGSPFCIKLETFFRVHNISYATKMFDPRLAPRGKMPFVQWNGEYTGDSEKIIDILSKHLGVVHDSHLNDQQKQVSHVIRRMLEEATYFNLYWNRWIPDSNWSLVNKAYFGHMPPVIKTLLPAFLRSQAKKTCFGQGVSRYTPDEISEMVDRDLEALTFFISDSGPFFWGDKVSKIDYTVYAFLASILVPEMPVPVKTRFQNHKPFRDYISFFTGKYFPELLKN